MQSTVVKRAPQVSGRLGEKKVLANPILEENNSTTANGRRPTCGDQCNHRERIC